jgi:hypothetical protein
MPNATTTPHDPRSSTVTTCIDLPVTLRVKLDEVRLQRARREGTICPSFRSLVVEALQNLADEELGA